MGNQSEIVTIKIYYNIKASLIQPVQVYTGIFKGAIEILYFLKRYVFGYGTVRFTNLLFHEALI